MNKENAILAKKEGLQPYDNGTGQEPFYRECDADLTTMEGRVDFFCKYFDCDYPELERDPDEPQYFLIEEKFIEWTHKEGVSLEWIISGYSAQALREYRKANKQLREFVDITRKLETQVQAGFRALLEAVVVHELPMTEALSTFDEVVKEFRSSRKGKATS